MLLSKDFCYLLDYAIVERRL